MATTTLNRSRPSQKGEICFRCGNQPHQPRQRCGAYGKTCKGCGKKDDFDIVCQSKKNMGGGAGLQVQNSNELNTLQDCIARSPLYFNELGDPVFANMVSLQGLPKKYFQLFSISLKSKASLDSKILQRLHTGGEINCMNDKGLRALSPKMQPKPSEVLMDSYEISVEDIVILGKSQCFLKFISCNKCK